MRCQVTFFVRSPRIHVCSPILHAQSSRVFLFFLLTVFFFLLLAVFLAVFLAISFFDIFVGTCI